MQKNTVLGLLVIGLLAQGCVSAGTHEKLQKDYDQSTAALATCGKNLATDEKKLNDDENRIHDLNVVIKDLETKLGSTSSAKLKLESNVTEMKTALEALTKQRAEAEKRIQEFRDLAKQFKSLVDTGKLSVKIVDGQMVVVLSSDVLFASGSAHLSKEGIEAVQQVSSLLSSIPDRKFQVEGFTDNVPIKTAQFPSNWELASARAITVLHAMLDAGMPGERLSASSFGDNHPVQANDTDLGRKANRRIEIVVVPDLSSLPGYDQLQKISGE